MKTYKFECGCEFPIIDENIKDYDGLPKLDLDYLKIPLTCKKTWDTLSVGDTKGVFQLETDLGMSWACRLKPDNMEELSALGALLRPGCLKSIIDGKSMTLHYIDRKFKREPIENIEDSISNIMNQTLGVLVYQEQAIEIAKELAGFSLEEADTLRKGIGKKDASLMTKVEKMFIEGCKKVGKVDDETSKKIFGLIKESQRYSFNKCLHSKTLVETKNGFETLENIEIGDCILAPKNEKENEFIKVKNKYINEQKELFEFTTESGKKVICTLDHKFLCEDGIMRPLYIIINNNHKIMCDND